MTHGFILFMVLVGVHEPAVYVDDFDTKIQCEQAARYLVAKDLKGTRRPPHKFICVQGSISP